MTDASAHPIIRHVPNALTLLRVCCIPVFVVLFLTSNGHTMVAGIIFAAAAFTDFFDGFIARRFGALSRFGKMVDPIADRLLVNVAAVLVAFSDRLVDASLGMPWWSFLAVMWRDVIATIGFVLVRRKVFVPDVNRAGKAGTALMMGGLGWIIMLEGSPAWEVVFWVGFGLSALAIAEYWMKYKWTIGIGERPGSETVHKRP